MLINNYATKLGDNSELKLKPPAVCLNKKSGYWSYFQSRTS